jgi:phosphatidate cytidylyltransferase
LAAILVLAWIGLAFYYAQGWAIALLLAITTLWAGLEYIELAKKSGAPIAPVSFLTLSTLIILGYSIPGEQYGPLAMAGAMGWLIVRYLPMNESVTSLWGSLVGLIYLPYLLHFFYPIYFAPGGLGHSLLLLALVWGYDIGAYIVGSLWGKDKFYPSLSPSPQKSWEGIAGGIAGGLTLSLVIGLASKAWIIWPVPTVDFLLQVGPLALLIGCGVQLGDFFESKLKRAAGVKDAGTLFPGHGGLLDRIDGLLFALPLFYGYLHYVLGWL